MPESTVLALAGVLGLPLIQLLKNVLKLSGPKMLWFTFASSFIIMLIAAIVTRAFDGGIAGVFADPDAFVKAGAMVFTATSLFYGSVKDRMSLGGE